ncbi:MAG: c-type cytochrome [Bacteroidia bacterium]|nr:c-type cytochrome [Bacteroidia bacterium]MDW8014505.1 c-type cytochrome [Bacteroidia bacterium]
MDTGILHTHHLLAVLLLVLVGAPVVFRQWAQRLRKVHMVLDSLLLLTGLYLLLKAPNAWDTPYIVKYVLTLVAIGLALIGSRRQDKRFSIAAFLLLAYVYGVSLQRDLRLRSPQKQVEHIAFQTASVAEGEKLYQTLCQRCHGADGRAHYRKSATLHPIQNPDTNYWRAVILAGRGVMPAHPYLSESQLASLVAYLRQWQ